MHEFIVGSYQASVPMSLHTDSPFPIMGLCRDLNYTSGDGGVLGLPEKMLYRDKFRVCYIAPAMYAADNHRGAMPEILIDALLSALLRPQGYSREHRVGIRWRDALSAPRYPDPYPHPEELTVFKGAGA